MQDSKPPFGAGLTGSDPVKALPKVALETPRGSVACGKVVPGTTFPQAQSDGARAAFIGEIADGPNGDG